MKAPQVTSFRAMFNMPIYMPSLRLTSLVLFVLFTTGVGVSQSCDASLNAHVYHGPRWAHGVGADAVSRLRILKYCATVSGTLHFVRYEKDGDLHLTLSLASKDSSLLAPANAKEHGQLVIELMCVKTPSQADTVHEHVCDNFSQKYTPAMNGKAVKVTGVFVQDMEHGWNEIHPVTSLQLLTH